MRLLGPPWILSVRVQVLRCRVEGLSFKGFKTLNPKGFRFRVCIYIYIYIHIFA